METNSRDERQFLADVGWMAKSLREIAAELKRIANVMEDDKYGVTGPELRKLKDEMAKEAGR